MEDTNRDPTGDFSSRVSTLACPEDEDYVYLGGSFSHVSNLVKSDGEVAMFFTDGDETKTEVLEANNIVRFNVNTFKFSPLHSTINPALKSFKGIRNFGTNNTLVRTISCTANSGASCSTMYVGGVFTHVFGMEA